MVLPPGISFAARSTSIWIHWWSPVASANLLMRSWSIVTQSDTPTSWPTILAMSSKATVCISLSPLDDAGFAFAPIAVADEALIELAGGVTRQFLLEIHRARAFDRRELLAAIGHQLVRQ